jgi:dTDP-glucose 4,6-dehydratase
MSKRVLITGSAGFVGSHFVTHFLKNTDWDIIGLDSFRHRGDSVRVYDPDLNEHNHRYQIFCCDLNAPISDRLALQIGHVDYIINLASDSHVDRSIDAPVQNNINIMLNILEYARKVKPEKFIHQSTDEIYGAALEGKFHKEWELHLPSSPYAASKCAQNDIAFAYWRTFGVPLIITSCMNMVGEKQDAEKFIPMTIRKLYKGEEVLIHGTKDYIGKRHYLHSRNLADAVMFILNNVEPIEYHDTMEKIIVPENFNIVGEKELDNLSLAKMIAKFMGKQLRYKLIDFHQARPGHDRRYALDGSKIEALGWKPPVALEESIRKIVIWTLSRPEWLI